MTDPQSTSAAPPCAFCDLMRGATEVSVCYEDPHAVAFLDIQPVNPGHVLVVARQHFEALHDVPHEIAMHLFDVALRLESVVRQVTHADGVNIVVNSGAVAGQDVFHHHVHVIPRAPGDGFDIPLPFPGSLVPNRTRLDAMAALIIAAFRDPMRVSPKGRPAAA
jgi:histidine triad (HIT) family protein